MGGPLSAAAASQEDVEILMEGQRYRSPHDYKRGKLKDALSRSLSPNILRDFSDDEIFEIITEIRKSHQVGESIPEPSDVPIQRFDAPPVTPSPVIREAPDSDSSEMQKMLKKYQHEHAEADAVIIDPDKVKNIFIKPKHKVENSKN